MRHGHGHHDSGAALAKRQFHNRDDDDDAPPPPPPLTVVYVTAAGDIDGNGGGDHTAEHNKNIPPPNTQGPVMGVGPAVGVTGAGPEEQPAPTLPTQVQEPHPVATKMPPHPQQEPPKMPMAPTVEHTAMGIPATHINPDATFVGLTTFATATAGMAPTLTTPNVDAANATSDPSSEKSPSTTSAAAPSGGLTTGAKVGIAIGVVLGVGLLAALIFLCVFRKRRGRKKNHEVENEKIWGNHGSMPPAPTVPRPPPPIPIIPQQSMAVEPPQLDVRPITQFAPDLTPSQNGALAGAGAGAVGGSVAAASRNLTGQHSSPRTPLTGGSSPNPFGDPVNPFGNQAEASSPPTMASSINSSNGMSSETTAVATPGNGSAIGVAATSAYKKLEGSLPDEPKTFEGSPTSSPQGPTSSSPVSDMSVGSAPMDAAATAVAAGTGGFSPGQSNVHRVQMDFTPSMDDELELRVGQLVRLLHEYDDGWV